MSKIAGFILAEERSVWETARQELLRGERVIEMMSKDGQADVEDREQAARSLAFIHSLLGKI